MYKCRVFDAIQVQSPIPTLFLSHSRGGRTLASQIEIEIEIGEGKENGGVVHRECDQPDVQERYQVRGRAVGHQHHRLHHRPSQCSLLRDGGPPEQRRPSAPRQRQVYEYILFRGTDIKDLQVKATPHNDPAINQQQQSQQHSNPASASFTLPSLEAAPAPDLTSQQYGLQDPNSQSQYQHGSTLQVQGSLPLPLPGSAPVPSMYWPGYYTSLSALPPNLQQPPWLPQTVQYPGLNHSLPSGLHKLSQVQPPSLQPSTKTQALSSGSLLAMSAPTSTSLSEPPMLPNMETLLSLPLPSLDAGLPLTGPLASSGVIGTAVPQNLPYIASSKPMPVPGSTLAYQTVSGGMSSSVGVALSGSTQVEKSTPLQAQSGQLSQIAPSVLSSSFSTHMTLQTSNKEQAKLVEVDIVVKEPFFPDPPSCSVPETMEPILPLPNPVDQKYDGAGSHYHHNFRGRGRGRGSAFTRSVTEYTEEFDFTAMNVKFNKDEVWGHLGKKYQSRDIDDEPVEDSVFGYNQVKEKIDAPLLGAKPVYVKDDFFDSLSCGTFGRGGQNGRPRFSERFRMDTDAFGDFPRHHQQYRGGGWGHLGGGHSGGSYYGGRGYGSSGRGGRGSSYPNQGS